MERLHSPRLQMALIVAFAGCAGFFASVALLHLGLTRLGVRYPIAVVVAYTTFLLLLWSWLRLRRRHRFESHDVSDWDSHLDLPSRDAVPGDVWRAGGGRSGGGGASASYGEDPGAAGAYWHVMPPVSGTDADGSGWFDAEDAAGAAAIAALAVAIGAAVWMIVAAPTFFAELMLDSALAAGLYRRLGAVEEGHWLRTAIGRTGWLFVCVMLGFALAGALMQAYAPSATSIGQVIGVFLRSR